MWGSLVCCEYVLGHSKCPIYRVEGCPLFRVFKNVNEDSFWTKVAKYHYKAGVVTQG